MWPWKRQGTDPKALAELQADFATLKTEVRAALRDVSDLSERAYKFLKRAEARSRRELDATNQEPAAAPEGASPVTPSSSSSPRVWGARGRRLMRALRGEPVVNGDGE